MQSKLKILYLGSVIKQSDCNSHVGASIAANKMQLGILNELFARYKNNLCIYSQYPIASFPIEKKVFIKHYKFELENNIFSINVPFINIFLLKQFSKVLNTFFLLLFWALRNKNNNRIIITFNSFPDISLAALAVTKLFRIKSICILADLPIDVVKRSPLKKIARNLDELLTRFSIKKYSSLVVLNKNAVSQFAPHSQYIVIDGGIDENEILQMPLDEKTYIRDIPESIIVVFSGALVEYNGIKNLIELVKYIQNKNFRLKIYGSGPLQSLIIAKSEVDPRIQYMGNVSNDEMRTIQRHANFLINPRPVNHPVSLVTFPSKLIEYLASGTPVISTKLNGITKDFYDCLFILNNEEPELMAQEIDGILSLPQEEIEIKTKRALQLLINKKTWKIQSQKLIDLIESTYN